MAKKLKWKKEKGSGNVMVYHKAYVTFKGKPILLDDVKKFTPDKYTLPVSMFPRDENLKCKHVKSLAKAKKMVQEWFDIFIKENQ